MTLEEFETEARDSIERILNRLQTANLLAEQSASDAQAEIVNIGRLVADLSHLIEDFIQQQRHT